MFSADIAHAATIRVAVDIENAATRRMPASLQATWMLSLPASPQTVTRQVPAPVALNSTGHSQHFILNHAPNSQT